MTTKSDRPRYPRAEALAVAEALKAQLTPVCERIEIAGSLRRGKPAVGDIELVCIPKPIDPFYSWGEYDQLDAALRQMISDGLLRKRRNKQGRFIGYGIQNKYLVHVPSGIGVDVFSTEGRYWGMALVVRTGPKEFNIRMMTRFRELGMRGHAYGGSTDIGGTELDCPDEEPVFRLLGWPYMLPEERT